MKKHMIAATACSLALLMGIAPVLAACGGNTDNADDDAAIVLPDQDTQFPELPEETLPEEPALPDDETQPESPEVPEETPEQPEPEPDVPAVSLHAEYVLVNTNGLNVRRGAGTSYTSLGQVDSGDMLHLAGRNGDWYETRYRGKTAYVSAKTAYTSVATLPKASDAVERVIDEGLKLLGVPYVYGAVRLHDGKGNFLKNFTTDAFDCSSLMQYIFYKGAGILLDVTTRTQVKQGTPVAWKDIQRGDLLFYTNAQRYNKTGVERIGHVALYLGENYILHTASDYAVIEQMSATRQKYFITGRRVL